VHHVREGHHHARQRRNLCALAVDFPAQCATLALPGSDAARGYADRLEAQQRKSSAKEEGQKAAPAACHRCGYSSKSGHANDYCHDHAPRPRKTLTPCTFNIRYPMPRGIFIKGRLIRSRLQEAYERIEETISIAGQHRLTTEELHLQSFGEALGWAKDEQGKKHLSVRAMQTLEEWFKFIQMRPKQREALLQAQKADARSASPAIVPIV
jgi:hypothetical protein